MQLNISHVSSSSLLYVKPFTPKFGQNVNITSQPTLNLDDKNKDWLCNAFELCAMKYPTSHLYLLGMQASINVGVYTKKIQVKSEYSMVYHEKQLQKFLMPCLRKYRKYSDQLNQCTYVMERLVEILSNIQRLASRI